MIAINIRKLAAGLLATIAGIGVVRADFPFLVRTLEKNSVADYSFLNHCPAGKYGYLCSRDGEFMFANGEKIRFFGLNLVASRVFDNSHEEADALADQLSRLGVNMVRIHHLTPSWQNAVPFYEDRKKSTLKFNPAAMEKLDYLLYALKLRGIYVTNEIIDSSLTPAPGEIPEYPELNQKSKHEIKLLMLFDPQVQAYVKKWIQAFYGRTNRYTGTKLIEDAQLALLGIVNEVSIGYNNGALKRQLDSRALDILQQRFDGELKAAGLKSEKFDPGLRRVNSIRFWNRTVADGLKMWRDYMRSIGYKGLFSGSNFGENLYHFEPNLDMDFMDAHLYWGFASYMDGVDSGVRILPGRRWNALVKPPWNENRYTKELFARFSLASLAGKALVSSEHRSSIGNSRGSFQYSEYRAAGLPFFATIQAFQQWDGFYVFASQGNRTERMGHRLDVRYDSTYLATFPLSSFLLRGNVIAPAKEKILIECNESDVFSKPSGISFYNDGLFYLPEQHEIRLAYPGMKTDKSRYTKVFRLDELKDMRIKNKVPVVIRADTGEFFRNWEEGFFMVNTAKVQGVEGFLEQSPEHHFRDLTIKADSPAGVFFVSCGRSESIAKAKRLLFIASGECINSNAEQSRGKGWSLPGSPPVLLKPLRGKLLLKSGRYRVWILGERGERLRTVAEGVNSFSFDTGRDRTLWYELEKQ